MDASAQRATGEGALMARLLNAPGGAGALAPPRYLTPKERMAMERAPRRGTIVSVWAKPVHQVHDNADHMWVSFDDGRKEYIARGGPNGHNDADRAASALLDDLSVMGQVDLAQHSPDFGQASRLVDRTFLPGVSADAAAADARHHAAGVNRGGNPYDWTRNSNSFAADVFERKAGRRPGDFMTPGYETRLTEGPPVRPIEERAEDLVRILTLTP
jgi:hypothetical protein